MEFGECVAVVVDQTEIYYVLKVFKGWYLVDYHLTQYRHDVSRVETVGDGNTVNHDFLFHKRFMFCPRSHMTGIRIAFVLFYSCSNSVLLPLHWTSPRKRFGPHI